MGFHSANSLLILSTCLLWLVIDLPTGEGKSPKFVVTSDGTAVADAPIRFTASMLNPDRDNYLIIWTESFRFGRKFDDNLNATNNYTSHWQLTYYTADHVYGRLPATVSVYYKDFLWWSLLVNEQVYFNITRNFTGSLDVWQSGQRKEADPILISTKNETTLIANFHDPSDYLKTANNLTYIWHDNNGVIANASGNSIVKNFTAEGNYYYNVTLFAVFNSTNSSAGITKTGTLEVNVTVKAPVSNLTVKGALWFPHGKLLDLNVTCDGSPPFTYCWWIHQGPYNLTGNESCKGIETLTNTCEFPISNRYFSNANGTFSLLILVYNDISQAMNQSMIHVYLVHQKQPLSIIVVPVTCSLVAIILIIFGIAYYMEHQTKYNVEVANFDFGEDSELPYVTFAERLKTVMSARSNVSSQRIPFSEDDGASTSPIHTEG